MIVLQDCNTYDFVVNHVLVKKGAVYNILAFSHFSAETVCSTISVSLLSFPRSQLCILKSLWHNIIHYHMKNVGIVKIIREQPDILQKVLGKSNT